MEQEKKFDKVKYNNRFIAEKYDRINLTVPKGMKEQIADHAARKGESVNGFIGRVIEEAMEREKANGKTETVSSSS